MTNEGSQIDFYHAGEDERSVLETIEILDKQASAASAVFSLDTVVISLAKKDV